MADHRPEKPEVKAAKGGYLYIDVEDLINSKIGRDKIRTMSAYSKKIIRRRRNAASEAIDAKE
jgi:PBP1b-binding outer membrane lipoprotein LpoB